MKTITPREASLLALLAEAPHRLSLWRRIKPKLGTTAMQLANDMRSGKDISLILWAEENKRK